jgi:hypothetical protein
MPRVEHLETQVARAMRKTRCYAGPIYPFAKAGLMVS